MGAAVFREAQADGAAQPLRVNADISWAYKANSAALVVRAACATTTCKCGEDSMSALCENAVAPLVHAVRFAAGAHDEPTQPTKSLRLCLGHL